MDTNGHMEYNKDGFLWKPVLILHSKDILFPQLMASWNYSKSRSNMKNDALIA